MYEVRLSREAAAFYKSAQKPLARKLARCFAHLAADPRVGATLKPLVGSLKGYWRYRIGDHRVIYRIDDASSTVLVAKVAHRSDAYR